MTVIEAFNYKIGINAKGMETGGRLTRKELSLVRSELRALTEPVEQSRHRLDLMARAHQTGALSTANHAEAIKRINATMPAAVAEQKRIATAEAEATRIRKGLTTETQRYTQEMDRVKLAVKAGGLSMTEGATHLREYRAGMSAATEARKRQSEAEREALTITRALATDQQRLAAEQKRLTELVRAGALGQEQARAHLAAYRATLPGVVAAERERQNGLARGAEIARRNETASQTFGRQLRELNALHRSGAIDIANYNREYRRLGEQMRQANTPAASPAVAGLRGMVGSVGALAAGYVGLTAVQAVFSKSMAMEDALTTFEVFTGSVEKGKELFDGLIKKAATSPISFDHYGRAAQTLLSYNATVDSILPSLDMLGNISAGNAERFNRLAFAFGQVTAAGILQGDENRQLIEGGFNPLAIIANKTGQSMKELKKQMAEGGITAAMVTDAMREVTSEGGRFYGLIEAKSKTASGSLGMLRSEFGLLLADVGTLYHSDIAATFKGLTSAIGAVRDAMGAEGFGTSLVMSAPLTATMRLTHQLGDAWDSNAKSFESAWIIGSGMMTDFLNVGTSVLSLDWSGLVDGLSGKATGDFMDTIETARRVAEALKNGTDGKPKAKGEGRDAAKDLEEAKAAQAAIDKTLAEEIEKLKERNLELAQGAEWVAKYKLLNSGASPAIIAEIQHQRDLAKEREAANAAKDDHEKKIADAKKASQDKADQEAKASAEKLVDKAKEIRESFRTPTQKLAEEFAELNTLAANGLLTANELNRAKAKATEETDRKERSAPVASLGAFSTELYAALNDQQKTKREIDGAAALATSAEAIAKREATRLATQKRITQELIAQARLQGNPTGNQRERISNTAAGNPRNAAPGAPPATTAALESRFDTLIETAKATLTALETLRLQTV